MTKFPQIYKYILGLQLFKSRTAIICKFLINIATFYWPNIFINASKSSYNYC